MVKENIEVPLYVIEDLEAIRASGKYNMVMEAGTIYERVIGRRKKGQLSLTFFWLSKINERTMTARLDRDKYMAALLELGEVRGLIHELAED